VAKLHQILAVESGVRAQTQKDVGQLQSKLENHQLLLGHSRSYVPLKDEDERLPAERSLLQVRVPQVLAILVANTVKMLDITATRDFANCDAKADVVLEDGTVLLKDAPATYLLWLEKKLQEVHGTVCALPCLPPEIEWVWDKSQNCYKNKEEIVTARTQKVSYPLELSKATKEHPAQVVEKSRDQIVGHFTMLRYCGALPLEVVQEMKGRVETLFHAVKYAREQANTVEVTDQKIGKPLMKYIFGEHAEA
jgi:hypothetical protein